MTYAATTEAYAPGKPIAERALEAAIWCMLAASFVVYIEPAPVDVIFALVLVLFAQSRLSITVGVAPLFLLLIVYNIGGFLSYLQVTDSPKGQMFIITSIYMAISGVVFAFFVANDPEHRMRIISNGWIVGAFIAAVWGLIDYFHLPSPFPLQVLPGRAAGLFKDPNVFSTYLICPLVIMVQTLMLGQSRRPMLLGATLLVTLLGLFLSFSRGAWLNFIMASVLMVGLTFIVESNMRIRTRIMVFAIGGVIFAALAFMVLMSIPTIQKMFVERFALVQSYDAGETGRFGNQLRSLSDLAVRPFGYGPMRFHEIYGQDPHNTFLNAFSSYGWLGGITYFMLVISTLIVGAKAVFTRTPWRNYSIAVYCALIAIIFQGVQIDTEHWRHFYWMLGAMWGLAAATFQANTLWQRQSGLDPR